MHKLLVICGPTATGKTKLAAKLAKECNGELVSADSRQVYRGMDLTTGKDRPDVPIWLYDVVNPDQEFSVSHWVKLARRAISDIHDRSKLPILVGGTGLYIKAMLEPFETINIPRNEKLRQQLDSLTVPELQQVTTRGSMNNSDWNNPRRLIRKIEITTSKKSPQNITHFDALIIGLTAPIRYLDKQIDRRLKKREKQGLYAEIQKLRKKYSPNLPSMSAIGINEHAYVRRQITWFKKQHGILWFDITKKDAVKNIIKEVHTWYTDTT